MHNQNIIILAQQNWDTTIGTNPRNMAREFAKNNRVLYVNMPLDVNTVVRGYRERVVKKRLRVLLGLEAGLVPAEPNIWVYTTGVLLLSVNWLASRALFTAANRLNARWLANSIRKAARRVGFDSYYLLQDGLIYPGLELKQLLKPHLYIYNIRDYVLTVPYFRRHGPWMEPAQLANADLVTANSAYLCDYARRHNPHSYDIGQGCVLSMYQAGAHYALPPDLAAVPRPIIGYTGFLTGIRLDIGLLVGLARQRPDWSLVLIGPEETDFQQSALHDLPNVFFLGLKPPQELPAYLSYFDVCINPQAVNDITIGNYPLKIDEYLAMGKPVVATQTRTMELFQDYVYLAEGEQQWQRQLERALSTQDPARTAGSIDFAQSHTWAATVEALCDAVRRREAQPLD